MKAKKFMNNKGFTTSDIIIAIIIIVGFISIITTSFYNYYISMQSKSRQVTATNIMVDVIENIEVMEYDSITQESINSLIEQLKSNGTIQKQYEVKATIEKYNERPGNEQKKDLIKILKVSTTYFSNNKEEKFEITRLITK